MNNKAPKFISTLTTWPLVNKPTLQINKGKLPINKGKLPINKGKLPINKQRVLGSQLAHHIEMRPPKSQHVMLP